MALSRALAVNVEDGDGNIEPIVLTRNEGDYVTLRIGPRGKQLHLADEEVAELIDALRELQGSS